MSSYPTRAQLEDQRREFALDGAEDRPYHHLAHALVRRGLEWSTGMSRRQGGLPRTAAQLQAMPLYPFGAVEALTEERERYLRMYVTEEPHLRTRVAADLDSGRWAAALRRGQPARSYSPAPTTTVGGWVFHVDAPSREAAIIFALERAREQQPAAVAVEATFSRKRRNRGSYDVCVQWTMPRQANGRAVWAVAP
jgi:hypothetical protein